MHHRIAARALCRSPAMAMAIVALAAIQTGKLCLLATFPANSVSIVRRFYTSGTLPNERRTNHKRSSFLCAFYVRSFAQKILGGHRPPLQLGVVRDCRGAL